MYDECMHTSGSDTVNTTIGIRSLKYTGDEGFFMNDDHVKVRGFCDHNDFASVGMGVPDRIKLFRAQASRGVGGNGRRMSHNPPEPFMLDIYDRVGMVVMDENRDFGDAYEYVLNMGTLAFFTRRRHRLAFFTRRRHGQERPESP